MSFVVELEAAADAARDAGFDVVAMSGWKTRGHGTTPTSCRAVMWHDTVTPDSWGAGQLRALLRDGYDGLPGPIANLGLERDGTLSLIAAGRAYHAGAGRDPIGAGIESGNLHTVGLEAANAGSGSGERWTDEQFECAVVATRACGVQPVGHNEWAPSRKVDPWSVNMNVARDRVAGFARRPAPVDVFDSWWADMDAEGREQIEAMLDRARRDNIDLDSMVHQFAIFHRQERPLLQELGRLVRAADTSLQGVVFGAVNTIDAVRDLGYRIVTTSRTGVDRR